jgi:hypothetical protein
MIAHGERSAHHWAIGQQGAVPAPRVGVMIVKAKKKVGD